MLFFEVAFTFFKTRLNFYELNLRIISFSEWVIFRYKQKQSLTNSFDLCLCKNRPFSRKINQAFYMVFWLLGARKIQSWSHYSLKCKFDRKDKGLKNSILSKLCRGVGFKHISKSSQHISKSVQHISFLNTFYT